MPEAVIVSTARSPIGRANKGSLKDMRPDELTAQMVQAALDKGCQIQVGKDMLFEQIPAYLEFFGYGSTTPDELRAVARFGVMQVDRADLRVAEFDFSFVRHKNNFCLKT